MTMMRLRGTYDVLMMVTGTGDMTAIAIAVVK
jgi:hypothetical protein